MCSHWITTLEAEFMKLPTQTPSLLLSNVSTVMLSAPIVLELKKLLKQSRFVFWNHLQFNSVCILWLTTCPSLATVDNFLSTITSSYAFATARWGLVQGATVGRHLAYLELSRGGLHPRVCHDGLEGGAVTRLHWQTLLDKVFHFWKDRNRKQCINKHV